MGIEGPVDERAVEKADQQNAIEHRAPPSTARMVVSRLLLQDPTSAGCAMQLLLYAVIIFALYRCLT